jgi:signal transduction histidine kinase
MLHSLRARLIFMTLVVAVIAVACVGLLSQRFTLNEFRVYVAHNEETDLRGLRAVLQEHYQQHDGWDGVQQVLERIGSTAGKQLILVDTQRKMLATAPAQVAHTDVQITPEHNLRWRREELRNGRLMVDEMILNNVPHVDLKDSHGTPVGALYAAAMFPTGRVRNEQHFVGALNRTLLLAALISAGVALLVAFFLSSRILRPVAALTGAVRRMERGDLSQRVDVSSKDEIGELARSFNSMADSLTRAEQLRRNMVNDVAHELRTPLTNIRCQIETLQDGLVQPTSAVVDSLHEEAILLERLIDDLQDLSLAEAGQLSLNLDRVSVKEEVAQAVKALRRQLDNNKLAVQVDIVEGSSLVFVDSKRFGQILRNLLNNAIRHTPPGGMITIGASQLDSEVEIMIADTGCGIPAEDLPFVFERFYRSDVSRDRATGGAGLGLAIVKQIIAAHGGQIRMESVIGQGTSVYFTLPVFEPGNSAQTN